MIEPDYDWRPPRRSPPRQQSKFSLALEVFGGGFVIAFMLILVWSLLQGR